MPPEPDAGTRAPSPLYGQLSKASRDMLAEGFRWLRVGYPTTTEAFRIAEQTASAVEEAETDQRLVAEAVGRIDKLYRETWNSFVHILNERGLVELKAVEAELDAALNRLDTPPFAFDPNPGAPDSTTEEEREVIRSVIGFRLGLLRNVVLRAAVFGDIQEWDLLGHERASFMNEAYVTAYTPVMRGILRAWERVRDQSFRGKKDLYAAVARLTGSKGDAVMNRLREYGIDMGGVSIEQLRSKLDQALISISPTA